MSCKQIGRGFARYRTALAILGLLVLSGTVWLLAAELRINQVSVDSSGRPTVTYSTPVPGEVVLLRGNTLTNINARVASAVVPAAGSGQIQDPSGTADKQAFYRIQNLPVLTSFTSSPANGETGVAVTRETILRFSEALAEGTMLDGELLRAEAAGRRILSRVEMSSDRRTVTLFYLENLPSSARVTVNLDARTLRDARGQIVDADGDGQPGGVGRITFETLGITPLAGTAVIGRVFASELAGGGTLNKPLEGVTITVDGAEETLRTTTDANGNFRLDPCPPGRFFVHVDGRTAKGSQWPGGAYYPFVGKAWETVPGRKDNLAGGNGEIYLPLIQAEALKTVSATEDTTIRFPDSVIAANPALAGVSITVPANSLFGDNGTRGGRVGIAPVPPDRLPEPLPAGLRFPIVITVQTDGPLNFDQPVPACFPNLPDPTTGKRLAPGEKSHLYSFNHDKGEWEAVGPMTVSMDGKMICTDPGVGIMQPGWHGWWWPPWVRSGGCKNPPCCPGGGGGKGSELERCLRETNQNLEVCIPTTVIVGSGLGCAAGPLGCVIAGGGAMIGCITYWGFGNKHCIENECTSPKQTLASARVTVKEIVQISDPVAERISELARKMEELIYPFHYGRLPLTEAVTAQITSLEEEALMLSDGDPDAYMTAYQIRVEEALGDTDEHVGNAPENPILFAAEISTSTGSLVIRGKTQSFGAYELFAPGDARILRVFFYDPLNKQYGIALPKRSPSARFKLPPAVLFPLNDRLGDFDSDEVPDIVEFAVGTDISSADSDSDGIPDGAEIRNGTNPLDGRPAATGVIATTPTAGTAIDVAVANDRAVTAEGDAGVSIFNVFNAMEPVLVGRVDTTGTATAVAAADNFLAVADGLAGLQIVDITSPSEPRLVRSLEVGGFAHAVTMLDRFIFTGTREGRVVMMRADTGTIMQSIPFPSQIDDLITQGTRLFVLSGSVLHAYSVANGLVPLGKVTVENLAGASGRRRLSAGTNHLYVANQFGYEVVEISNPSEMKVVGLGSRLGPFAFKQIVDNGSGLGVAAVGVNADETATHDVHLFDLGDPLRTDRFLTLLPTPGAAQAVALHNGLAYVADGSQGLQVVNYLAYDNKKNPPTGELVVHGAGTNLTASAGALLVLQAAVRDDVQVREVEFLMDGASLGKDGSHPFERPWRVPANFSGRSANFTARVTDTGGNSTSLGPVRVTFTADAQPPTAQITILDPSRALFAGDSLPFGFLAGDDVGLAEVRLLLDGQLVAVSKEGFGTAFDLVAPNSRGEHQISLVVTDAAGNSIRVDQTFRVGLQAVSREFTLFNFGPSPTAKPEAVSREFSIENKPKSSP